jgi:hypothetical protein
MTTQQALYLKPGSKVIHSHYGPSTVQEIMKSEGFLFGIVIIPDTDDGKALLRLDAGVRRDMPLLEDSPRRLRIQPGTEEDQP